MSETDEKRPTGERTLRGWTEIAAYCDRTKSTVKRWAAERGLPVHRIVAGQAGKGVPVYAYPSELDAWLNAGRAAAEAADADAGVADEAAPARGPRQRLVAVALALLVLIAGLGWFSGLIPDAVRPGDGDGQPQVAEIPEDARELYLRGTYLWNRRTPEGIDGAIDTFGRALEIHPDYAEAHAGLAMTYNLARQYSGMSGFDAYPKAEAHARRAVELDPTLGFAHSVLAFVEFHWLWDVEAGLARFEDALRLDPDSANTLMWYASSLLHVGRSAEALPLINKAQQHDPHSSAVYNMKAMALFYDGQTDAAADLLREIMARDPHYAWSYPSMYYIQLRYHDYAGYLENYARLGELIGVPRYGAAAAAGTAAFAEGGLDAMAAAMIAVEADYYERGEALAWDVARHHAMAGDAVHALRWLDISFERHEERLIGLLVDTAFDPIRDDDGFKRLLTEIGLPASG